FITVTSHVFHVDRPFFHDGFLEICKKTVGKFLHFIAYARAHLNMRIQTLQMLATGIIQYGFDLRKGRFKRVTYRTVGHLLYKLARKQHGSRLFLAEHDRRKMVTIDNKITYASLGANGHARFHQCLHVAIDCSKADVESTCQFLCFYKSLGLKMNQYRCESVDAVHEPKGTHSLLIFQCGFVAPTCRATPADSLFVRALQKNFVQPLLPD